MSQRQKTTWLTKEAARDQREWWVVDLEGQMLGRAATRIASVLRGKHKPNFTPNVDGGDFVVCLNADKVKLTGQKLQKKLYRHHTKYIGGLRETTAAKLLAEHPDRVVERAVWGMLPKGPLGRRMIKKLKVYRGADHAHAAQKPRPLEL
jgi:large subunit ribosomal protein L13